MQITNESVWKILGFSRSDESDGRAHSADISNQNAKEKYMPP